MLQLLLCKAALGCPLNAVLKHLQGLGAVRVPAKCQPTMQQLTENGVQCNESKGRKKAEKEIMRKIKKSNNNKLVGKMPDS